MAQKTQKRAYNNPYGSVTQIIDVLRKPGLENWFRWNTPQFIKEESEKGKTIGTSTHAAIESYILTGKADIKTDYPDEVTSALKGFIQFRKDRPEVKLTASEMMLTSELYKFNGTMDAIGNIDGVPICFDWKTSKKGKKEKPEIYDEYLIQISSYVYLYNEVNKTNVDRAIILSLAKDDICYNTRDLNKKEIDGYFHEMFLPALKIWNFQRREK